MGITVYFYKWCNSKWMKKIYQHKWGNRIIMIVGGRKADSHGGNGFGNNGKKLRKTYVATLVAVDILPKQCNFLITFFLQILYFVQDAIYFSASLSAASVRDYTIVAEVVASAHNADKSANTIATNAFGNDIAVGLCCAEFYIDGFFSYFGSRKKFRQ